MENENDFLEKIKNFQEADKIDLSSKEDLAIGIMNLIGIEEHLFFTYGKTGKEKYLEILNEIREMRKNLLAKIVKNPEGEIWCISKHLLSASMRLLEVGTKKNNEQKQVEAKEMFDKAYKLWNIFWGLNLNLLNIKDAVLNEAEKNEEEINLSENKKASVFDNIGKMVKKMLDCCRE